MERFHTHEEAREAALKLFVQALDSASYHRAAEGVAYQNEAQFIPPKMDLARALYRVYGPEGFKEAFDAARPLATWSEIEREAA